MTKFNLEKTRAGERRSTIQSYFYGESRWGDEKMIQEVKDYMISWLEGYNNSLTNEEIEELFEDFDGDFSYDVWSFELVKDEDDDEDDE